MINDPDIVNDNNNKNVTNMDTYIYIVLVKTIILDFHHLPICIYDEKTIRNPNIIKYPMYA